MGEPIKADFAHDPAFDWLAAKALRFASYFSPVSPTVARCAAREAAGGQGRQIFIALVHQSEIEGIPPRIVALAWPGETPWQSIVADLKKAWEAL